MKKYLDKLDKYESALNSLNEMIAFDISFNTKEEKINEAIRDSIIKKFEYTFELAWKAIKEYLEKEGYEEINSPKKVLKKAFEINLIKDEELWSNMLEARNSSSYRYDENYKCYNKN